MPKRLTVEDWLSCGFRMLVEKGPQALKAEVLARALGATKGSFYWHFKDVPQYRAAMLELWRVRAVTDIIEGLRAIDDPQDRLRALGRIAAQPAPERFGGAHAEPAIRAWGLADPDVAAAIRGVDDARIAYLRDLLVECDRDPDHATVIYGGYIGLDELAAQGRPDAGESLAVLIELILKP